MFQLKKKCEKFYQRYTCLVENKQMYTQLSQSRGRLLSKYPRENSIFFHLFINYSFYFRTTPATRFAGRARFTDMLRTSPNLYYPICQLTSRVSR